MIFRDTGTECPKRTFPAAATLSCIRLFVTADAKLRQYGLKHKNLASFFRFFRFFSAFWQRIIRILLSLQFKHLDYFFGILFAEALVKYWCLQHRQPSACPYTEEIRTFKRSDDYKSVWTFTDCKPERRSPKKRKLKKNKASITTRLANGASEPMEHQAQKPKLPGLYQAQETKMLHQRKTRFTGHPWHHPTRYFEASFFYNNIWHRITLRK